MSGRANVGWVLLVGGLVVIGEAIIGTVPVWTIPIAIVSAVAGGVVLKRLGPEESTDA